MFLVGFALFAYLYTLAVVNLQLPLRLDVDAFSRVPLINIRVIDLAILFASGCTLFFYVYRVVIRRSQKVTSLHLLILLYILFHTYQFVRTYGALDATSQFALYSSALSMFFILYCELTSISEKSFRRFFLAVALFSSFFCLSSLLQSALFLKAETLYVGEEGRLVADIVSTQKITVGSFSLLCIGNCVGILALQIGNIRKWQKAVLLLGVPSQLGVLIFAWHRGLLVGWLLTLFAAILVIPQRLSKVYTRFVVSCILLLVGGTLLDFLLRPLGFAPVDVLLRLAEWSTSVGSSGWDKGRFLMWEYALKVFSDFPVLGIGYDFYDKFFPAAFQMTAPHNFFITSLLQNGVVGTVLQTAIYLYCFKRCFLLFKYSRILDKNNRVLIQGVLVGVLLWVIPALTQEVITERYTQAFQHISFGLVSALVYHLQRKANIPHPPITPIAGIAT